METSEQAEYESLTFPSAAVCLPFPFFLASLSLSVKQLTNGLEDPAQVEKELNIQLRSMGLYAANTMGDGNCLFRALSDQLYGYPHQHGILREQVCDYLATKADKFAAFIDVEKPFEEYVRTMRQSGTYGGHLELSAFAQLQQKEIKIVQPGLVYIVSGDDESPQATKEREKKEKERQLIQSKTIPGSEGPPPSERELRRLRRERKIKGLQEEEKLGESSKMALRAETIAEEVDEEIKGSEKVAEAFGPLYIAYHNWEHYSSIRNVEGPHTGLPRIRESHGNISNSTKKESSDAMAREPDKAAEPNEEEVLILRSTKGYSLEQVRFYIKRHGGWEEAMEAILAQDAVEDDDETEEEDTVSTTVMTVMSSPDDAARADEAAGPSLNDLSATTSTLMGDDIHLGHTPLLDHLRDWRAASPSSVDTIGTHSSLEGGSTSTQATTDESPESIQQYAAKRSKSKRAASKDLASVARSPKRRSRSRSPMQPVTIQQNSNLDEGTLTTQDLDALHVRGTHTEKEIDTLVKEPSKLRVSSTKPLTMRERRVARQEEKAKRALEAKNKRRERTMVTNEEDNTTSLTSAPHVRRFLELKI